MSISIANGISLGQLLDYLELTEIAATVDTAIQSILHTTTTDWDAVSPISTRIDLSTPTESNIVGQITVGASNLTIGKAGRYEVIATANAQLDSTNDYVQMVLNGLLGSVLAVSMFRGPAANLNGPVAVLVWQGSLAVGDTIDLRVNGTVTSTTEIRAYSISIKELP